MIYIDWNPLPHLGPIPINWYGLTFLIGFLVGAGLVFRWALRYGIPQKSVEGVLTWIIIGVLIEPGFTSLFRTTFIRILQPRGVY